MDFRSNHEQQTFGVRATALIVRDGKIFLTKDQSGRYYTIGGAIHVGETSQAAVIREAKEEVGIDVEVDRLAFVVENRFSQDQRYYHNIEFHYLVKPLQEPNNIMFEGDVKQDCEWIDLKKIADIELVPHFLTEKLTDLSSQISHVVNFDDLS